MTEIPAGVVFRLFCITRSPPKKDAKVHLGLVHCLSCWTVLSLSPIQHHKTQRGVVLFVSCSMSGLLQRQGQHRWLAIPQFVILVGIGVVLGVLLTTQQKVLVSVTDIEESLTRKALVKVGASSYSHGKGYGVGVGDQGGLQVAWLQSFPNSGTSYTLRMVQRLSNTRTALNYGIEESGPLQPVFSEKNQSSLGPFWTHFDDDFNPNYTKPTRYALTKTHCGGRCVSCYPVYYLQSHQSFRDSCLATSWHSVDKKSSTREVREGSYPLETVGKAVHVIRNPYDNVVSR